MQTRVLRGTTEQNNVYTGLEGELTFDTSKQVLRVHDGVIPGGYEFSTERAFVPVVGPGPEFPLFIDDVLNDAFYGEVESNQFILPGDLTSFAGISEGTAINEDTPWLKFGYNGKILFIAKKPIRYQVSWNTLYAAGLVYGRDGPGTYPGDTPVDQNKIITIGELQYRVRLIRNTQDGLFPSKTNSNYNRLSDGPLKDSEWVRLILRVSRTTQGDWGDYTDPELVVNRSITPGAITWCQEKSDDTGITSGSDRGYWGNNAVNYLGTSSPGASGTLFGWRPVLELITE